MARDLASLFGLPTRPPVRIAMPVQSVRIGDIMMFGEYPAEVDMIVQHPNPRRAAYHICSGPDVIPGWIERGTMVVVFRREDEHAT